MKKRCFALIMALILSSFGPVYAQDVLDETIAEEVYPVSCEGDVWTYEDFEEPTCEGEEIILEDETEEESEAVTEEATDAISDEASEDDPDAEFTTDSFIPVDLTIVDSSQKIFGKDDRFTVKNPWQYPYCAIGYIVARYQCGCGATGTGFMVSKNAMITAAHCLVCVSHSSPLKYADFYFGVKSPSNYSYRYQGSFTYWRGTNFPRRRYDTTEMKRDFGYIRFNSENVGNRTGWFGLAALSNNQTASKKLTITGYRDARLKGSSTGKCKASNTKIASTKIDTLPGNSGCPVYYGKAYAAGILIAESSSANYFYRVTGSMIKELRSLKLVK